VPVYSNENVLLVQKNIVSLKFDPQTPEKPSFSEIPLEEEDEAEARPVVWAVATAKRIAHT